MARVMRVPDPSQSYDHLGNPEGGAVRYIEVRADGSSPQHQVWIARKRRERLARQDVQRVQLRSKPSRRSHRKGQLCLDCGDTFWPGSAKQAREALCPDCRRVGAAA